MTIRGGWRGERRFVCFVALIDEEKDVAFLEKIVFRKEN
jgi:hypothetical protein